MKLIMGLGNPGPDYAQTRHNLGFFFLDELSRHYQISLNKSGCSSLLGTGLISSEKVIFSKPLTYMNRTGKAVRELFLCFKLTPADLLVLHDDLDLPLGTIRKKIKGGDAGHRGIKSIIQALGTSEFTRLRLGIGRPSPEEDSADYVLSNFKQKELKIIAGLFPLVIEKVEEIISLKTNRSS